MRLIILGPKDFFKLSEILRWLRPSELIVPHIDRVCADYCKKNKCKVKIVKRKETYGKMSWWMQREDMLKKATGMVVFYNGRDTWLKAWMKRGRELGKDVYEIPVRDMLIEEKN